MKSKTLLTANRQYERQSILDEIHYQPMRLDLPNMSSRKPHLRGMASSHHRFSLDRGRQRHARSPSGHGVGIPFLKGILVTTVSAGTGFAGVPSGFRLWQRVRLLRCRFFPSTDCPTPLPYIYLHMPIRHQMADTINLETSMPITL
jgi:hypothetical protein